MEPSGLGGLMLAFEQLKKQLDAEGLFDPTRKKPIPMFPARIGVVTSATGAAVKDIVRIVRRRFPATHILVSPASVQGEKAPDEICRALERLVQAGDVDVVIIGRGGGSVEDLWAFNDERVVRATAACPLPTVSAVGHETDFTLTDFAADLRASTPSAAAELLVPDKREVEFAVTQLAERLTRRVHTLIERNGIMVRDLTRRLRDPRRTIQERRLALDELTTRLAGAVNRNLTQRREDVRRLHDRLSPARLTREIETGRRAVMDLARRLELAQRSLLADTRGKLDVETARLGALNPLNALARGYAVVTRRRTGEMVHSATQVEPGDHVNVRLSVGNLDCLVEETIFKNES
jgi:exodeoxyribonuclease VII large subunit